MDKKILIVIETLAAGGAGSAAVNLANGLAKRGDTVRFCAAPGPSRARLSPGILFSELPRAGVISVFRILLELNRIIKEFQPDIIHSQNGLHCFLIRVLFLFRAHPGLIFTRHSKNTRRMPDMFSGMVFNFIADRIIAVAAHHKRSLLRTGVDPDKVSFVPNFINMADWDSKRIPFDRKLFREKAGLGSFDAVLLISARLVPDKNVDRFIGIVSEVLETGKNVCGVIVGDGPERAALENIVKRSNLDGKVFFAGYVEDVSGYYLASDIFVYPTRREVMPMALIEACAAGLPIVCSDIPGNSEVVRDGQNGFLVEKRGGAYSEKVISLLDDAVLRRKFSANGIEAARNIFDEGVCIAETQKVYGGL